MENTKQQTLKLPTKVRSSNLELFRIISMILIVAHHYVVNSGLTEAGGPVYMHLTATRSLFLLVFGAFGKAGINCFLLITGYFMCKSNISLKKFLKLYGEIVLYRFIGWFIFYLLGREEFSTMKMVSIFVPFYQLKQNFYGTFIMFWFFIPFLNVLVQNLSKEKHLRLIMLSLLAYTVIPSLSYFKFGIDMNYVSWFCVLYFIASYIRFYPNKTLTNAKLWAIVTPLLFIISCTSVVLCAFWNQQGAKIGCYYFVSDSNKILAVCLSVSAFLLFNNLKIGYSKIINLFGAATFGVLLIHANSDAMRQWLWKDLLNVTGAYYFEPAKLIAHAFISVLAIYIICSVIDMLRISIIEKQYLKSIDKIISKFQKEKS